MIKPAGTPYNPIKKFNAIAFSNAKEAKILVRILSTAVSIPTEIIQAQGGLIFLRTPVWYSLKAALSVISEFSSSKFINNIWLCGQLF